MGSTAVLEHNADLFDGSTAERMLGHFRELLGTAVLDPAAPVGRLALLTPAEREQILVDWNATAAGHPTGLLHGLFEAQAARTPDREALVAGEERLTYAELEPARQPARPAPAPAWASGRRCGWAIGLGRTADLIVSLLAVLKAGGPTCRSIRPTRGSAWR